MTNERLLFLTDSLTNYDPYLVKEWKHHYFRYNIIKRSCQDIKANHEAFLGIFAEEIKLVEFFVIDQALTLTEDLNGMDKLWRKLNKTERHDLIHSSHKSDRKAERTMRDLYRRSRNLIDFFDLNCYLIKKMDKKYGKLLIAMSIQTPSSSRANTRGDSTNAEYESMMNQFMLRKDSIYQLSESCIDLYQRTFRQSHGEMTQWELEYIKRRGSHDSITARMLLGMKVGVACTMVGWIIADSLLIHSESNFWTNPAIYVYSTISGILLFNILWVVQIQVWADSNIDFISIFHFNVLSKRHTIPLLNHNMLLLCLVLINLIIYFGSNYDNSLTKHSFLAHWTPIILLMLFACYIAYNQLKAIKDEEYKKVQLFNFQVIGHLLQAPFVDSSYREIYAADVLTSFAKIIYDGIYATCYVLSGSFLSSSSTSSSSSSSSSGSTKHTLSDFGAHGIQCSPNDTLQTIAVVCICIPFMIRILQCLRIWTKLGQYHILHPHLTNCLKYSTVIISILLANFGFTGPLFYSFLAISTAFRWWWDVRIDWGLFDEDISEMHRSCSCGSSSNNNKRGDIGDKRHHHHHHHHHHPLLRPTLLYTNPILYYIAIIMDLILRFVFIVSVTPHAFEFQHSYESTIFLGCLEIIRRAFWGLITVEYNYINSRNNAIGVSGIENRETVAIRLTQMSTRYDEGLSELRSSLTLNPMMMTKMMTSFEIDNDDNNNVCDL